MLGPLHRTLSRSDTWTWFEIMPKTMPPLIINGKRVAPGVITWSGVAAAVATSVLVFLIVWSLRP